MLNQDLLERPRHVVLRSLDDKKKKMTYNSYFLIGSDYRFSKIFKKTIYWTYSSASDIYIIQVIRILKNVSMLMMEVVLRKG